MIKSLSRSHKSWNPLNKRLPRLFLLLCYYSIINTVDGYAISINRGADVLKYIAINKYDEINSIHRGIEKISKDIHDEMRKKHQEKQMLYS